MPIGIGAGTAIAAGIGAGASISTGIVAAHKSSNAQKNAATLQAEAEDKQRAYLEEKDRQDQLNYEQAQTENRRQFTSTQDLNLGQYNRREGQLAPYRASGEAANRTLQNWLNLDGQGGKSYMLPPTDYASPATLTSATSGGPTTARTGQNFDPNYVGQQVDAVYAQHGVKATGPGTGPTDRAYMVQAILNNKGWEPYWTDRIGQELVKAGLSRPPGARTLTAAV